MEGTESATGPLGIDLARPRTIVSFGAPLREGWGSPGTVPIIVGRQNEGSLSLVQIEAHRSPTAEGADLWLAIRPGTEAAVALGLAHVLVADGLVAPEVAGNSLDLDATFRSFLSSFEPGAVERTSGVSASVLRNLAHDLAKGPSLAIGSGAPGTEPLGREEESAIAALNLLLGNAGPHGCLVTRRAVPAPTLEGPLAPQVSLSDLADGSVGVLVIEGAAESVPWSLIATKLAPASTVVSLSPWLTGLALHADWTVPARAPLEFLDEVLTPAGAPSASWSLAPSLVSPPQNAMDPTAFLSRLTAALGNTIAAPEGAESLLKRRAAAIVTAGRGNVFVPGGACLPIAKVGGPEGLFQKLLAGGAWTDEPIPRAASFARFTLLPPTPREVASLAAVGALGRPERARGTGAALEPEGYVGSSGITPEPAILGKLGRESLLRTAPDRPFVPVTIREA
jgi:hypothetical protein